MKNSDVIIEKLSKEFGLKVTETEAVTLPESGVLTDAEGGYTVFCVESNGKKLYFRIDGCDEKTALIASLARAHVTACLLKPALSEDPVRAFLEGRGDIPRAVHLGKADFYVFAIYSENKHKDVLEYVSAMSSENDFVADMKGNVTAFCKKLDNDSDYQSAGEFALVLKENIDEEIAGSVKISVGGIAHGTSELPLYYSYAQSALVSGAEFDPKNSIYSYKEYALVNLLSDVPSAVMEKYVKTVLDKNYKQVLSDSELMSAADEFMKHSLNISEASRKVYVHRNTLIYRLDKIEKLTGLNIRNFNDAMALRVAYLISKKLSS